jgi:hypothetical protein
MLLSPTSFHDTVLSGSSVQSNLSIRRFYECMIPAMASPGQESESLNSQFVVDSMPAMIQTARPGGYLDHFNQHWLQYVRLPIEDPPGLEMDSSNSS